MTQADPQAPGQARGLDRRGFLRKTAGGGAAIALASALPVGCAADYPAAEADGIALQALSAKEYAAAKAAAEALLEGVPVSPTEVAATLDREMALVGDPVRADMKTVLRLLEHATILGGHFRRFTSLDLADRRSYLDGWATSRFELRRAVYMATQAFIYFFAYTGEAGRPLTGFLGPWPERVSIPAYPVDFGDVA